MTKPLTTDPARLPGLPAIIAADRFGTYLRACGGDAGCGVRLYSWNIEVAAAMWGPLHVLEVALRNAIHGQLAAHAGRDDWWEAVPLRYPQPEQLDAALRAAKSNHGAATTIGHSVAELSLGFWTALLANRYHKTLWTPALQHAFPYRPQGVRRGDIHARLEPVRMLRNRIAHHEPIFARTLGHDHAYILAVLSYLSPEAHAWVTDHSRVATVLAHRAACVAGTAPTSF
ncbi:MAG: hypothetical protein V7637_3373 [Mycobacteriales bacterium]|jgi:hypothetical protein